MLGLFWEPDIPVRKDLVERLGVGSEIRPEYVDPTESLQWVDHWFRRAARVPGDLVQPFGPTLGMLWVQAIVGCPIVVHPDSLWAAPVLESYSDRRLIRFDRDNPWVQKLMEYTLSLVDFAAGRFPVCLPVMHGPLDVLAAMRTSERMCLDIYEHPTEVFQTLGELSKVYVQLAEALLSIIPSFRGGWVTRLHVWFPDHAITPQNDSGALVSPAIYRRFVLPWDRFITESCRHSSYHLHSTSHHLFGLMGDVESITCLQVSLEHDRGGPSLEVMLAAIRGLLARRKPMLVVTWDMDAAEQCLRELPSQGLCLALAPPPYQDDVSEEYDHWLRERVRPSS